jgi:uncharacterized protein YjbI with pentapeptide repeats
MPRKQSEFKWEKPKAFEEIEKNLPPQWGWLTFFEWLSDWMFYAFDRSAFVRLFLQGFAGIAVLAGIISFSFEVSDREEERVLKAWKVIADGQKLSSNVGQKDALTFLYSKGKPLRKIDLSGAYLARIDLSKASLSSSILKGVDLTLASLRDASLIGANLEEANLAYANLKNASLIGANLEGANLNKANLEGADLFNANLKNADLEAADLEKANLLLANLEKADLEKANLEGANLNKANLEGADLEKANLIGADLQWAKLKGANLIDATLVVVKNLTCAQLESALIGENTKLPDYLKLSGGVLKINNFTKLVGTKLKILKGYQCEEIKPTKQKKN